MSRQWTPQEIQFLLDNYSRMSKLHLAWALGQSPYAVLRKATNMGLLTRREVRRQRHALDRECAGGPRSWTTAEEDYLVEFYGRISVREIGRTLRRTVNSIHSHAWGDMGLRADGNDFRRDL